ncbi:hypothetical protein WQQ_44900 [Hydrocarboniphaga effusa AP103]|uniref:Uncharacterized protein n=1 Tax=Hydrocarboniphaga effusa AP103 TaxID=1172194 RepID=I8T2D0_9GAMM|nr:hypothetical protein WQQ_44900 [Hydrocarboniphaga effusa AP103]
MSRGLSSIALNGIDAGERPDGRAGHCATDGFNNEIFL